MEIKIEQIDTLEGVRKFLNDFSLENINKLISLRIENREYCTKRFIIKGKLLLDTNGNSGEIIDFYLYDKNSTTKQYLNKSVFDQLVEYIGDIVCVEDLINVFEDRIYYTYKHVNFLNKSNCKCVYCDKGWSVDNLFDYDKIKNTVTGEDSIVHKQCNIKHITNNIRTLIIDVFQKSNIDFYGTISNKNQYGSEEYNGKWFDVETNYGIFVIGWRKRVIHIGYPDKVVKYVPETKETHGENYEHVWSYDKLLEALNKYHDFMTK